MAPLALTLALLAMAVVATAAIKVKLLDMAKDSFDDQYEGCGPAMTTVLPALNRSEFQKNPLFAEAWVKAVAEWQKRGPPVSPLSPDQAIALMAYTTDDMHKKFNNAVHMAGDSPQEYQKNFHYKTLHFLLTQALATLRDNQGSRCQDVWRGVCNYRFEAQTGDTVRFGRFTSTSLSEETAKFFGANTVFQVHTCYGANIQEFSYYPGEAEVLIPPFETFNVTNVTSYGRRAWIQLHSTGRSSKYNCEWLRGLSLSSISRAPRHLGGLLLATTALAVATGIL